MARDPDALWQASYCGKVDHGCCGECALQGIVAKLQSLPMILFKGVVKKTLLQDLNDIKSSVEQK